jgi:cytochrome bd ubiquinol oxidase subunit II
VALWGGLSKAYGVMLPALFLPLIVMLFSLVVRGASIEMISSSEGVPRVWGLVFGVGSLVASFAVLTGRAAVLLYGVAGAAFLQLKTDGDLRTRAAATGRVLLGCTAVLALLCALSLEATATPVHLHSTGRVVLFTVWWSLPRAASCWPGSGSAAGRTADH